MKVACLYYGQPRFTENSYCYESHKKYIFDRCALLLNLNRFNEALDAFNKAIMIDNKLAKAYAARAVAKYMLNKIDGACADLKTAKNLGFDVITVENLIKCK